MPLSFPDLQAPGPIPVQVPVPFSSLPADYLPASSNQAGSFFATPDHCSSASGQSTRSSRQSAANNDRGGRNVNQTVVPQSEHVSSSSADEEDAQEDGSLTAATSAGAQVATSGVQLPASRASSPPSQSHSRSGVSRTSFQDPSVQDPLVRDPLLYAPFSADPRYYFDQFRDYHEREKAYLAQNLALKDAQMEQWRQTLRDKDDQIRRFLEENDTWRARHQSQSALDPQLGSSASGSSYPTLDQLTTGILAGGWPNLHDPFPIQSAYRAAAQRGGYGVYQPGPNIAMLPPIPPIPFVQLAPHSFQLESFHQFYPSVQFLHTRAYQHLFHNPRYRVQFRRQQQFRSLFELQHRLRDPLH